jgi:hypothetical protein
MLFKQRILVKSQGVVPNLIYFHVGIGVIFSLDWKKNFCG